MSEKVDIYMPIFIGDYLKDTNRLSASEHGAYLLLMFDYWQSGSLPDNDTVLARIACMGEREWDSVKATVMSYFKMKNGEWHHSRIDRELNAAKAKRKKQSARGKAGANARWNATSNASSNATSIPQAMPKQCQSPSPLPLPSDITITTTESLRSQGVGADYVDDVCRIMNCQDSFGRLQPVTIARMIMDASGNARLEKNLNEFVVDASNSLDKIKNPTGMLRAYLAREDRGSSAKPKVELSKL